MNYALIHFLHLILLLDLRRNDLSLLCLRKHFKCVLFEKYVYSLHYGLMTL